jgi:chaperonin GroEL (HSP60 family)
VNSSYKSGTVVGGGIVYLRLSQILDLKEEDLLKGKTEAEKVGFRALKASLESPFKCLCKNSRIEQGHDLIIKTKILGQKDFEQGYDMLKGTFGNLREVGVIEPANIAPNVIENSFSIVQLLLNSKAVIMCN